MRGFYIGLVCIFLCFICLVCLPAVVCAADFEIVPETVPESVPETVPAISDSLGAGAGVDVDMPAADARSFVPSGLRAGYYLTGNSALGKITLYFPVEAADVFSYYSVSGGSRLINMSRNTIYLATNDSRYSNYSFYAPSFDTIYYRVPGDNYVHNLELNYSGADYNIRILTPLRISYEDTPIFLCILAVVSFIFVIVLVRRR